MTPEQQREVLRVLNIISEGGAGANWPKGKPYDAETVQNLVRQLLNQLPKVGGQSG